MVRLARHWSTIFVTLIKKRMHINFAARLNVYVVTNQKQLLERRDGIVSVMIDTLIKNSLVILIAFDPWLLG